MNPDILLNLYGDNDPTTTLNEGDIFSLQSSTTDKFMKILTTDLRKEMHRDVVHTVYDLNPADTAIVAGKLRWDAVQKNLLIGRADGISVFHINGAVQTSVKATEALVVGSPLYIVSQDSGYPTVGIAKADNVDKNTVVGFSAQAANIGDVIHMYSFGILPGVDASLVTSGQIWLPGDMVWLTPAGIFTNIMPAVTLDRIECGLVIADNTLLLRIADSNTFYYDDGGGADLYKYSFSLDSNGDVVFSYREV